MPRVSDYTTEELARLTTLTQATMRVGEFVDIGPVMLRTTNEVVTACGTVWPLDHLFDLSANRRVRSFTDLTELDPPQGEMLAELERRRRPVPKFTVGDLICNTHDGPRLPQRIAKIAKSELAPAAYPTYYNEDGRYIAHEACARPATDAEVAAYHRKHGQKATAPSNTAHAGRRMRNTVYNPTGHDPEFRGRVVHPSVAHQLSPFTDHDKFLVYVTDTGTVGSCLRDYVELLDD